MNQLFFGHNQGDAGIRLVFTTDPVGTLVRTQEVAVYSFFCTSEEVVSENLLIPLTIFNARGTNDTINTFVVIPAGSNQGSGAVNLGSIPEAYEVTFTITPPEGYFSNNPTVALQISAAPEVVFTPNIVFVSRHNTATQQDGELAISFQVTMTADNPLPVGLTNVLTDIFRVVNIDGNNRTSNFGINMNAGDTTRTQSAGINYPVNINAFDVSVNFPELDTLINEQPGNTITVPAI